MRDKAGKTVAVILAGGLSRRMGGAVKKQFALLAGRPLIAHTLQVFQHYDGVDEIVLVVSAGDADGDRTEADYVKKDIIDRYGFTKVKAVVTGGAQRYHSVYAGLSACGESSAFVLVHDGARAFITKEVLDHVMQGLVQSPACVAAVHVKDTIKRADSEGIVKETLDRKELYAVQTPQAFAYPLIMAAYGKLMEEELAGGKEAVLRNQEQVTDDAMVVERYFPKQQILLVEGAYDNIKVTTPEDLAYGEFLLRH